MNKYEANLSPENLEALCAQARLWVRGNIGEISAILERLTKQYKEASRLTYKMFGTLILMEGHFGGWDSPPQMGDDIFSNSVCDGLVNDFPDDLLQGLEKHHGYVLKPSIGKMGVRRKAQHSFFTLGPVIIDPTSGQFFNLDKALKSNSGLFEGRALVAPQGLIESKLKITYKTSLE